jgi:flagellar biosynthesis protein FlhB
MSDLLSAATLLITVITFLYSSWFPEITEASKRVIKPHADDRKNDYQECRAILNKTIFLCVVTILLFFINLPDTVGILVDAIRQLASDQKEPYSAIATTFTVVEIIIAFLAVHLFRKAFDLGRHVSKLKPN